MTQLGKTVTVRWLVALNLGVTRTKRRLGGLEAAVLVRTFTIRTFTIRMDL